MLADYAASGAVASLRMKDKRQTRAIIQSKECNAAFHVVFFPARTF